MERLIVSSTDEMGVWMRSVQSHQELRRKNIPQERYCNTLLSNGLPLLEKALTDVQDHVSGYILSTK